MESYKNGYYKNVKEYIHHPNSEKDLFRDSLTEYMVNNMGTIHGVELGVLIADTSKFLLELDERINLIGIDPIIPDSMNANLIGDENIILNKTKEFGDRFKFKKDFSYNVVDEVSDDIDFIFIDASHHYEDVEKDYKMFFVKVKKGGLIYFHDSRMYRGGAPFHVGSSKYVDHLIETDNNIELVGEAFSLTCFIKK